MEEYLIPYEEAYELKQLEFDLPTITYKWNLDHNPTAVKTLHYSPLNNINHNGLNGVTRVTIPLYEQVFKWFRDKYDTQIYIEPWYIQEVKETFYKFNIIYNNESIFGSYYYDSYEEAQLACLQKLIKLLKDGNIRNTI